MARRLGVEVEIVVVDEGFLVFVAEAGAGFFGAVAGHAEAEALARMVKDLEYITFFEFSFDFSDADWQDADGFIF